MLEALMGLAGTVLLAVVGWAFQTHSEIKVLQARDEDYKELVKTHFDAVNQRLSRIEKALNGQLKGH